MGRLIRFLLSLAILGDLAAAYDIGTLADTFRSLSPVTVLVATVLLVLNQAISALRFHRLIQAAGLAESFRLSWTINNQSIAAGLVFFNFIGQTLTRSALLSRAGGGAGIAVLVTAAERAA